MGAQPRRRTAPRGRRRAPRTSLIALLVALVAAVGGSLPFPDQAAAQATATECGYGTGGPYASNLCWFDMSQYDDAQARSSDGQQISIDLPGGYTARFTLTSRSVGSLTHPTVAARSVPLETRFAFGESGYVDTPGLPALYSQPAGGTKGLELQLTDIEVVDAAGAEVTGYSFVIADAENNVNNESFTWTSDEELELIGVLSEETGAGCSPGLTGIGTTAVTCTGTTGSQTGPRPWYDGVVVGADTPTSIALTMVTFAQSGVAFGILTSKIQVSKAVVGRVRGSDSFDVTATSPEGSVIATASTAAGDAASTGELTVLPRSGGALYTLSEAATPGTGTLLSDYSQSWSCTDNGEGDPSLPSGAGTSVMVSPEPGDHIHCTVTNTQLPADLFLLKSASPSPFVPGQGLSYELAVTNHGPSRATGVVVTDQLPAGVAFVSGSDGCGESGGTVTCTLAELPAHASHTFTVQTATLASLEQCPRNTASVASAAPESFGGDNTASSCPDGRKLVDLSIAKTASQSALPAGGGQVAYTLVVRNGGPSDATDVVLADPLPPGLAVAAVEPSQGDCSTGGGRVECRLGRIAARGSAQVLVTANAWATPGEIANTATVTSAGEETDVEDNHDTARISVAGSPVPQPSFDLAVEKRSSIRRPVVGQRVTYRIVVRNHGPHAAPGVQLTDTLNVAGRVVSTRASAGSCQRRLPLRCQLGTIAAGETATVTVVAKHLRAGSRQRNAVSVTGAGADTSPESNNVDTVTFRTRKVRLRLSKRASVSTVVAGGTFRYTIRLRNRSRGVARAVRVCDRLPAGLAMVRARPRAKLRRGRACWRLKRLGPRRKRTFRVTVRALRGARGAKINRVAARSADARRTRARAFVRVRPRRPPAGGVTG